MTKILIKKLVKNIKLPKYETDGSSGLDINACTKNSILILPGETKIISTGFSISVPTGYEVQIRPRSGLAAKSNLTVLNTPGTIDSDYRGEVKVILINLGKSEFLVEDGMRIAQMVLCPIKKAKLVEVDDLKNTSRGSGGFGSTGLK
tara:strand:+ start:29 stop:469 length:441 start_codon:yes stop_codon:yes gene_type:complete